VKFLNKHNLILVIILVIFTPDALSENIIISEDDILSRLEGTSNEPVNVFVEKMREVSLLSKNYIQTKQDECSGEFTTIVINDKGEKIEKNKKLTGKERKLCLYMLIKFRIQFTKIAYRVRKQHLRKLQKHQMDDLLSLEKSRVGELLELSRKYKR